MNRFTRAPCSACGHIATMYLGNCSADALPLPCGAVSAQKHIATTEAIEALPQRATGIFRAVSAPALSDSRLSALAGANGLI